jgi:hypothetical protein
MVYVRGHIKDGVCQEGAGVGIIKWFLYKDVKKDGVCQVGARVGIIKWVLFKHV